MTDKEGAEAVCRLRRLARQLHRGLSRENTTGCQPEHYLGHTTLEATLQRPPREPPSPSQRCLARPETHSR
jgi:hypothetical protein